MQKKTKLIIIIVSGALIALLLLSFIDLLFDSKNNKSNEIYADTLKISEYKNSEILNCIFPFAKNSFEGKMFDKIIQDFKFNNQNIKITYKYADEFATGFSRKYMSDIIFNMINTGKIKWDIIWIDDSIYNSIAIKLHNKNWADKYLINFEKIKGFSKTHRQFIINNKYFKKETGNIITGPYLKGYYYCIWYNKNIAKTLNIDIKNSGMMFSDFIEYIRICRLFNEKYNTNIIPIFSDDDEKMASILFYRIYQSYYTNIYAQTSGSANSRYNNALLKSLQAFELLAEYKPLLDDNNFNDWLNKHNLTIEDKALFYIGTTRDYIQWADSFEDKINNIIPAELPAVKPVETYPGNFINNMAIMSNTTNKTAAVKFINFICDSLTAYKWCELTNNPTGIKLKNIPSDKFNSRWLENFHFYITSTYKDKIEPLRIDIMISGKDDEILNRLITKNLIQILKQQTTSDKAYNEINNYIVNKGIF